MDEAALRVVLHPVHVPGLPDRMRELPDVTIETPIDTDAVAAVLADGAPILVTFLWDDRFLTESLRWVQATSAGIEQFPLEELRRRSITLTSARGAHSPAVAEHAVALLLATVRGIGTAMRDAPQRDWSPRPAFEVSGRTLGVLGLGTIGEEVALRAAALGMRVIGTKRDPTGYDGVAEKVLGPAGTLEVCREADAVVIALPGSPDTERIVGAAEMEALRDGWLVNVGRGSVVDEDALVDALKSGTLRGAGLDVFATEPLPPDSPLWDLPTAVITPHAAWSSDRVAGRLSALFSANLEAFRGEGAWQTPVT